MISIIDVLLLMSDHEVKCIPIAGLLTVWKMDSPGGRIDFEINSLTLKINLPTLVFIKNQFANQWWATAVSNHELVWVLWSFLQLKFTLLKHFGDKSCSCNLFLVCYLFVSFLFYHCIKHVFCILKHGRNSFFRQKQTYKQTKKKKPRPLSVSLNTHWDETLK